MQAVGQVGPPQSTSVSSPFATESLQLGAAHVCAVQTPLVQSGPTAQPIPTSQGEQAGPPQSRLVSEPFFTPSLQVGARQVVAQTPSLQSLLPEQGCPWEQRQPPPQSTSGSLPFFTPSVHEGALHFPPTQT